MALTQINPALFAGSSNTTAVIQSNGTTAITVDSSQNVGVGTASPLRKFHVKGSGNTSQFESTSSSSYVYIGDSASSAIDNQGIGTVGNNLSFLAGGSERMRIDSSGNVLINTTTALSYFNNYQKSGITSAESLGSNKIGMYSFTNSTAASNNATVTTLRFLTPTGTILGNAGISGIVSVYVTGNSGANAYTASYTLNSDGNGTTDAALTIINAAKIRGTSPVSSIQFINDGGGGAIALTLTYINNSGVVTGGFATFGFHGLVY
jgi:fibronectin-binding autotransporter adhesin